MAALAVGFAAVSPLKLIGGALAVGASAYSLFHQQSNSNTGKLSDLKVACSTYGRTIPKAWGTIRCSANMIWSTDFIERKRYISSKGKDKTGKKKDSKKGNETYEYYANFAVALCEGPMEDVLRIWCDSNLIYDKLGVDDDEVVEPGFSESSSTGGKTGMVDKKGAGNDSGAWSWRFYPGSEDQLQDSYMVKVQGKENVPAFRGICYLMFEDFPLKDFGNRIPNVTAEVVSSKDRQIQIETWSYMTNEEAGVNLKGVYGGAWFDHNRMRVYEARGDGSFPSQILAIDVQKGKEVKRWNAPSGHCPIGVTHEGTIASRGPGGPNCYSVGWIDPDTGELLNQQGGASRWLGVWVGGDGTWYYTYPENTHIAGDINPLDGEVKYYTLMQSMFGPITAFDDGGYPKAGTEKLPDGTVCTSPPTIGGAFYVTKGGNLYRGYLESMEVGGVGFGLSAVFGGNGYYELVDTIVSPSSGSVSLKTPIYCAGADRWILPYSIFGGSEEGAYVIVYNNDLTQKLWTTKVNSDTFTGLPATPLPVSTGNKWAFMSYSNVYVIDAKMLTLETINVADVKDTRQQFYLSNLNALLVLGSAPPGYGKYGWYVIYFDKYKQGELSIGQVVSDACEAVGVPASRIDTSELDDTTITGYIMEDGQTAKSIISTLSSVYLFDTVESDGVLKFVMRGKNPVVTIPEEDLGIVQNSSDAGDADDAYKETITQEVDLPRTVVVSFINPEKDYETGSQHARRPLSPFSVMQSKGTSEINLPIAMTTDIAKQLAEKTLYSIWNERTGRQYTLPWQYVIYDPSDVMQIELSDGSVFTDRILQFDFGADYTIECQAIAQLAAAYSSSAVGSGNDGVIGVNQSSNTIALPYVADIPYATDADATEINDTYGLYWGAAPYGEGFKAGSLMLKDAPADFDNKGGTLTALVWGVTKGKLAEPEFGPEVTDDKNSVLLVPAFDYQEAELYQWESIPAEEWPSLTNMILIGGEIILFRDVDVQDNGSVVISHLIRGYRGTEHTCNDHKSGERWQLLNTDGNQQATLAQENVGETLLAKLSTPSALQYLAPQSSFVYEANNLKPWAPGDIRRTDGSGNVVITWKRRTRFNGALKNGDATVPLDQSTERYRIYVTETAVDPDNFDPTDETAYKRVAEVTSSTWTYTAANLSTDGLTSQSTIYGVVYQMSDIIGHGFGAAFSLQTTIATYKS